MKYLVLFICLVTMVSGVRAATKYRDFTSADGKTIRGCIQAYDAVTKTVTIERDNKRTSKVPITMFSEADQSYILEWDMLRTFTGKRFFKISAKSKMVKNKDNAGYSTKTVEDTTYVIMIENGSKSSLKGIKMEYCIYYEKDSWNGKKLEHLPGVRYGSASIDSMGPRSKKTLKTDSVSITKTELDSDAYFVSGRPNVLKGEVLGIKIRFTMETPSGQKKMREYCKPEGMQRKAWSTSSKSKPGGLNK